MNEKNIVNTEVGELFFGSIPKYNKSNFFNNYLIGWRIIEVEVVKVLKNHFFIAWNNETRRNPQKFKKGITTSLSHSKVLLWENVIELHKKDLEKKKNKGINHNNIIKIAEKNIIKLKEN